MTTKTLNNGNTNPWLIVRIVLVMAALAAFVPTYHMGQQPYYDNGGGCNFTAHSE